MTSGAPLRGTSASTSPDVASIASNTPASQAHSNRPVAGSSSNPCGPAAGTSYSFKILVGLRASIVMIRAGEGNVDEEHLARRVVNRPPRATRDLDFGDPFPARQIDDRYRMRVRNRGVADVRDNQNAASRIERESVRLHAYDDLERVALGMWRKHRDRVFASIGCKNEATRFGRARPCRCHESGDRLNVKITRAVDHVDPIVAGMRNVEPICGKMNIRVIEATLGSIRRKLDVTE